MHMQYEKLYLPPRFFVLHIFPAALHKFKCIVTLLFVSEEFHNKYTFNTNFVEQFSETMLYTQLCKHIAPSPHTQKTTTTITKKLFAQQCQYTFDENTLLL